jgi:cytochrome c peroxidase
MRLTVGLVLIVGFQLVASHCLAKGKPESAGDRPAVKSEEVLLGSADLTSGIPGTGPLTIDEIKKWLDNPRNHIVLKPILPQGMAAGAGQITGIEKNPLTRAKIELGRQLYFDTRLSKDNSISCASCHDPVNGYAKDTRFGVGVAGQLGGRNSPVAYNRILSGKQFWDGRADSLEEQAKGPIANPIEMSNTHDVCVHTVGEIPGYKLQFEKIFPDGVTIDNMAKAIASFERALVTGPSPWDYYTPVLDFQKAYGSNNIDEKALKDDDPTLYEDYMKKKAASDAHPISDSAKRGGVLFFSDKAACTACHVGANFTDELYHNLGVGMEAPEPDVGRAKISGDAKDTGAFKTPTIRNVALTGPYMHDGSQKTLEEVVEWYAKGGHPNPHLDAKVKPLKLTNEDKADLVEFMRALSGDLPQVERGRLPQ